VYNPGWNHAGACPGSRYAKTCITFAYAATDTKNANPSHAVQSTRPSPRRAVVADDASPAAITSIDNATITALTPGKPITVPNQYRAVTLASINPTPAANVAYPRNRWNPASR
jgi:hypothetical protein